MKQDDDARVFFHWFYQGELGSGHKPEITIELEG